MTLLTKSQYEELQKVYESSTISKMGYNQHWPKALRYGNITEVGLNLPNLYLEQFILHIKNTNELLTNEETNGLMINVLQMFQLSTGLKQNLFRTPQPISHGSSTWVKQLVNECSDFDVSLIYQIHCN